MNNIGFCKMIKFAIIQELIADDPSIEWIKIKLEELKNEMDKDIKA